ncbi:MAG: YbaB/EbfC family nucleoid-associated protein [Patescibacteria group bacterium]|nr:YbaB/EbfC family nucleoid-associated protein [Patescibacteria group bacterium]
MFKNLAGLGSIIRHAQQFGGQLQNLSEEMKQRRATGTSGGGMVEVEVNGLLEVLRCTIDEQLARQNDRELLEDLVVAAVNQAIFKGKQLHAEAMKGLTGGLELPGLNEAIARFTGTSGDAFVPGDQPDADETREV